jgi:hypothetical protein
LAVAAVTASPAKADDNQTNDLNGAWKFLLSIENGPSFTAIGTFTKDGIFVGTAQGDGMCCASQGAAHGTWQRIGPRSFSWNLRALETNADFSLAYTLEATLTVTLDQPDHMTGTWTRQIEYPNGTVVKLVGGSITGSRYAIP